MHTFCFSVTAGDSTHDELTSDAFHALTEDEPLAHLHDGLACLLQPEKFLCEHFPPQYNTGVFAEEAGKQVDDHHYIGLAPDVVHQGPGYFSL